MEKIGAVSSLGEQGTVNQLGNRALDSKEKTAACKGSSRRGVRELGSTVWWAGGGQEGGGQKVLVAPEGPPIPVLTSETL